MNKIIVLIIIKSFYPDGHHFLLYLHSVYWKHFVYAAAELNASEVAYQKTDSAVTGTKADHLNLDIWNWLLHNTQGFLLTGL